MALGRSLRRVQSGEAAPVNSDLLKLEADAKARIQERVALAIRIGMDALSFRLLSLVALILNAGVVGWSLLDPRWERIATCAIFAIFSYFVIHVRPNKGE